VGNIGAEGWGPEEIAGALYELTANHLTALRENDALDYGLQAPRAGDDTVSSVETLKLKSPSCDAAHAVATSIHLQMGKPSEGRADVFPRRLPPLGAGGE
jgi:hypothetical protein